MKKKVLSALLAAALFVGMAIPAFAEYATSSLSGADEEITDLVFTAGSYDVKKDAELDLSQKVTAFAGKDKLVQNPTLEWSIEDNNVDLAFDMTNAGVVTASEDKGTAVVTVTANDGKVKATTKLVAAKADAEKKNATAFKFQKTSYTFTTGNVYANASDAVISVAVVPTTANAIFTPAQLTALKAQVPTLTKRDGTVFGVKDFDEPVFVLDNDNSSDSKVVFKLSNAAKVSPEIKSGKLSFASAFAKADDTPIAATTKTATVNTTKAVPAIKFGKTGSVTIEVGQTFDLSKKIKFGSSNANVGMAGVLTYENAYYNDDAEYDDYAVLENSKVLGVAVGTNKIKVDFTSIDPSVKALDPVYITVKVVAKGALAASEAKLAADKAALTVGGTYWLEVKNAPSDVANIKWTVEKNGVATILPESGAAIKIFAKKAGTAKVTATYNGVEIGTCVVTVTAAGTTTPVKPGVENPATGDSLFANLF